MRSTALGSAPSFLALALFSASLALGACAKVDTRPGETGGIPDASAGGAQDVAGGRDVYVVPDLAPIERIISTKPSVCGDGERGPDEACDDGNAVPDDGCSADCRGVDPGFSCAPAGRACHRIARCGDSIVVQPELCDDGNTAAGDGCSSTCKLEVGFKCEGAPSRCSATVCGDKKKEGAESCDDGNVMPFDGCSADCQNEPSCGTGVCTSPCGDGLVVTETCDDGNDVTGDGCSSLCAAEPGFTCKQPALGDKMLVPAIYRDFRAKMPSDFEPGATGRTTPLTGMVKPELDAEGKPVYTGGVANSYVASAASFAQWYRPAAVNHATTGKLTLYSNGKGAYVNRWGPNGEPWPVTVQAYYCGNAGEEELDATTGLPIPCTSRTGVTDCAKYDGMAGYTRVSCTLMGNTYRAVYQTGTLDGTPAFFPVDGDMFTPAAERSAAGLGPPYADFSAEPGSPKHNFHFTSEVRYWFRYDATKTFVLDFTGDDDVWVFINRRLAVDLGGIHTPAQGSVTFGAGQPARFDLKDGQVYEVAVFQAERQTNGSSYRLTLSGFSAAPSECTAICGDGILSLGEECDDGTNPGGYGQCGPGCKLGEFCGDGVVQPDYEDCDDGVNISKPCPSGCKVLIIQ